MHNISMAWVFSGKGSRFSSGVFMDKGTAMAWILRHKLTGVLTQYPVGQGVYDWAIEKEFFEPKKEHESSPDFIQKFTCAGQEHYHFEDGELD